MATSKQTPRVWSDAIRGSEILANWFKLGANAVVLWLSIGMILGGTIGGSGSSRAPRRWIADCGCTTSAMVSASAARSPICPIRRVVESGSRCPRQRCSGTRATALRP